MSTDDLSQAIAEVARTINRPRTLQETLEAVAEAAVASVPGINHVGISTIDRRGNVETRAATSEMVWKLDRLQYDLGEGPCVDSLRGAEVVQAPHICDDDRWPRYVPAAVELGLQSQLAVKLYTDQDGTIGGLNLYSTETQDLHPSAVVVADVLATHAALTMGKTRTIDQLGEGLKAREHIGVAVGILMVKYDLDAEAAFAFLARTSSTTNTKIRMIAERIVADQEAGRSSKVVQD